ncbi:MAG: cytochrome c peroxidase [Litorimonas sp.]
MKYVSTTVSMVSLSVLLIACGGGESSSTSSTSTTSTTNSAPTVASAVADQSGDIGFELSFDATQTGATFTDANSDTLTYAVTFSQDIGLSATAGTITGVPNQLGDITVTVQASDPSGGTASDSFTLSIGIQQAAIVTAFGANIDLANLDNYAAQPVPAYIGPKLINANPVTDAGATLGRVMFYDVNLSIDNSISCASCHGQANGFSDLAIVSNGVGGGVTGRHSMRLINGGFAHAGNGGGASTQFWDQRAATHEDQETQPIQDVNEHGFSGQNGAPDFDDLITKMEGLAYYEELFRFAYLDADMTEARIGQSLAQFTKSIQSFDTRYDAGRAQVANENDPFPNFTAQENQGKANFTGQGTGLNCAACHQAPEFTIDTGGNRGHNGVVGVASDPFAFDFTNTRAPTLRDMVNANGTLNGPLMHDGSLPTLRAMLDHYSNIPTPGSEPARTDFINSLDGRLRQGNAARQFNLSDANKDAIEAFLLTLSGTDVYTDPKWSDPF